MDKKSIDITKGFFWTYAERITAQFITLLVSIVLARLLEPEHYGTISIVMIFISLCNAFVTGGLGSSLVQKKNTDDLDFNTMLLCSLGISFLLYTVLFFLAPLISTFYNMPLLRPVIRVLGLRIPISGINSIQHAKIQKDFAFKKFFFATLIGTIISAIVGIYMAFMGFGVWAIVAQYLTNTTIDTVVLFLIHRWGVAFKFSFARAKSLLKFGWKVMLTTIVYTIEGDIRSVIIGKVYGAEDLAFYDQGKTFPDMAVTNIITSISKVVFPALAKIQDDFVAFKQLCRESIRISMYLLCPLLIGLIAVSDKFVEVVLTEKWIPCIPYLRILTLVFLTRPFTSICHQSILAIGKSSIILKIQIIINAFCIMFTCFAVFILNSILWIAWGTVITEIISVFLFSINSRKIIEYKFHEQVFDVIPSLFLSCFMGVIVFLVGKIPINQTVILILQLLVGIILYLLLSYIFRIKSFFDILLKINNKRKIRWIEKVLHIYK